ncbi:hypothetical protein SKAU_G00022310 [Synaphobranchus kaupii]|uniref:Uncharacterized protein n=1 Tax=Synaphobranchus kaupii TaxID=118154 RepID=A0A9Q1GDA8_SYNKA|nr:hypothetical protein SKAU_G00022310 [Synaphobranchus kaupii]
MPRSLGGNFVGSSQFLPTPRANRAPLSPCPQVGARFYNVTPARRRSRAHCQRRSACLHFSCCPKHPAPSPVCFCNTHEALPAYSCPAVRWEETLGRLTDRR